MGNTLINRWKKWQLVGRLLFVVAGFFVLAACAKPPVAELTETRRIVAHVYASGAPRFAADLYQLASESLQLAETQVANAEYQAAEASLALAQTYSNQAMVLIVQRKLEVALEQQRVELEKQRITAEKEHAELLKKQQIEQARKPMPKKEPLAVPAKVEPAKPALVDQVEVFPAENLLMIAARPEVYNDGLLWPLIYKANRDQIKDPKEIFPGQKLLIPRDKGLDEMEAARREAEELRLF